MYANLRRNFQFQPTLKQDMFFQLIADFVTGNNPNEIFVLKGYAGTGKTSVISALVKSLPDVRRKFVLMAPTGRAAKVISGYSGENAFTIHRKIYYPKKGQGGGIRFQLMANKHRNTLFIVDEASMIADAANESSFYENGSLLDDLIEYVYTGQDCKLLLLGDTAQLPPVNAELSPALDVRHLQGSYHMDIRSIEFDEVMRQAESSGILHNATLMRERLEEDFYDGFQFELRRFKDIIRLTDGYDIQDAIHAAYGNYSIEDTAFIVRSNKRANQYNQQIRMRILDQENLLSAGDFLMVVKNNYFWLKDNEAAGFIANGDIIEVLEIHRIQELYGFEFARVKIRMVDYPDSPPLETVLLLNTLTSESASLTSEESQRLYQNVLEDYQDDPAQYRRLQKLRANEYFNALQVKFSYAITCHKSQGGQWNTVFVEQPYLPDGPNRDYFRWLYTACTRATDKLYLINFPDEYFS